MNDREWWWCYVPVNQTIIHCFLKVDIEREFHVSLSIGAEVDLSPDILRHLQSGHQVQTSLYGLTPSELATLGVGHLGPATV